jgi:fructose-1,6-bisphosphatase/inositol monophosphatase family enzyme
VIEAGLNAYDIQAPIALIQAAGGIVTDWQGGTAHHGGQVIAAATAELHAAALELIQQTA